MSYLVPKNIPSCCAYCSYNYSSLICKITMSEIDRDDEYRERLEDCPLIEVKTPHGRLIDAAFEEQHYTSMTTNPTPDVTEQDKHNSLVIVRALQMAKTIIEAEE